MTADHGVLCVNLDESDLGEGFYHLGWVDELWTVVSMSVLRLEAVVLVSEVFVEEEYVPVRGDRDSIWPSIETLVDRQLADGMTHLIVDPPHSVLLGRADRTVLVDVEGSGEGQVVYAQAACHGLRDRSWIESVLVEAGRLGRQ